jgi:DNA processing protein
MPDALFGRPGPGLRFDADDPVLARAAWSRLAEPGDPVAGALVDSLGPVDALRWLVDAAGAPEQALSRDSQINCKISYSFYLYLILHACAARFDVTGNLVKF